MPRCSVCGREFPNEQLIRCGECGKASCKECAEKDSTIKQFGVCPDCEELYETEEDYWAWGEEEAEW